MSNVSHEDRRRTPVRRRTVLAGAAGAAAAAALPLRNASAQGAKLKIGVLLPRSGLQAQLGIDAQRGVDLALAVLPGRGYPTCEIVQGDTETNVQTARARTEKLIEEGCHMILGCFDSGQTMAAAQVCEQRGIPFVVNIAAVPALTEQGYVGSKVRPGHGADGYAEFVEVDALRLGKRRQQEPLGLPFDQKDALRKKDFASGDVEVSLKIRDNRRIQLEPRGRGGLAARTVRRLPEQDD